MTLELLEYQLIDRLNLVGYFLDAVSVGTAIGFYEGFEDLRLVLLKKGGKVVGERRCEGWLVEIMG